MSAIAIRGLLPLQGQITVQGSKNAVLPMMAASILHKGTTIIDNVPRIQDVFCMMGILSSLGCDCKLDGHRLEIDATDLSGCSISREEMGQMRSSIMLLGPLLGRCREAVIFDPGGCRIGERPIDLHLMALKRLGAEVCSSLNACCGEGVCADKNVRISEAVLCGSEEDFGEAPLRLRCERFTGTQIVFPYPSVGATENAIFAAVAAEGTTVITGCAREPEIRELCLFLNGMGAFVSGGGTSVITVEGGRPLHDSVYRAAGDRIVAGTYLLAAAGAGGELVLTGVKCSELHAVTAALRRMGANLYEEKDFFYLHGQKRLQGISVKTGPYPGFPTDLQSVMMALMCISDGESQLEETVFENRFRTAGELKRMGAEIKIEENRAWILGKKKLSGAQVEAQDLRGGAALAAAALKAEGTTIIHCCEHILRGYEDIVRDLSGIGADICYLPYGLQ